MLPYFSRHWIALDYEVILPVLARLPIPVGRCLARARGWWYGVIGRDWRQFSFADVGLKDRTYDAYREIIPGASDSELRRLVRERYIMQSLEELEAAWLPCRNLENWPVEYVGLDSVLSVLKKNERVVFVTAHFSSSILGTIHLRKLGVPVLGMSSNVVEDPRVHPSIGRFYRRKYAAMNSYLGGGKILDRQGNSREFIKFLKKRGAVVIVGDLPPDPGERALETPFFNKVRCLAQGPSRMAELTQSPFFGFVCEYTNRGFRVTFSEVNQNPYALIEKSVKTNPAAWWAADLLPLLPVAVGVDS